ncbi:MAG TPA: FliM/FliN family flagellar motor switch protein [Bryobacteraceae bacterium]|nr:FliM/FliN family flagellar motor switch protein [Bryobacteraceae bacterium]
MTAEEIVRLFQSYFKPALEMLIGAPLTVSSLRDKSSSAAPPVVWWQQSCKIGQLPATITVGATEGLANSLGDDESGSRQILFESLSQAALRVLDDLEQQNPRRIVPLQSEECNPPTIKEATARLRVECDSPRLSGDIVLVIDEKLAGSGRTEKRSAAANGAPASGNDLKPGYQPSLSNLSAAVSNSGDTQELPLTVRLLNLNLPVSIRIAETQLPIRDVMRLTPGSVVDLKKAVGELVDIVVHGSVLARGEIVSVKGFYGVKITEMADLSERLAIARKPQATAPAPENSWVTQ